MKNSPSRPYDASAEASRHANDGSGDRKHDLSVRELLRLRRGRDRKWQLADTDVGRVDAGALGVVAGGDSGGGSVKNSRSRPYDASAEVSRHANDGSGDRTHDLSVRELLRLRRGRDRKWG